MNKLFVLVALLLFVPSTFAVEIHVPADYPTIRAGIDAAASGDTVRVAAGTYVENITMKSGIAVIGSGAEVSTIDGSGSTASSVVTCNHCGSGTRLEGFTVTNGNTEFGGGMINQNSSPVIENCTFSNNTGRYGGGMIIRFGSPIITNCKFISNTSTATGIAIRNTNSAATQITGCSFTDNTSTNITAGGIVGVTITLTDCYFSRNFPKNIDGSYIDNGGNVIERYVDDDGPANFTSIQAAIDASADGDTVVVMPGTYYENIDMSGKAITLRSTDPTNPAIVTTTIINGDTDDDGVGNGSVITCDSSETVATVISGFVITNGQADFGGGMYNSHSSPTVSNCTFSGNTANNPGGGMYNVNSSPTVSNCTFSANTAGNGGGMFNRNSSPTVNNCTFSGNTADDWAGGMYNFESSSPTVNNCTFSGNTADKYDGGGMFNSYSSSPTVSNCTFTGNTADNKGGGMYNFYSSPTVTNCTFSDNTADDYHGGGIYNETSSPTVTDSSFCDNTPDDIDGDPLHADSHSNGFGYCVQPPSPPTEPELEGDIDGDGDVDLVDLAKLAANWLAGT